MDIRRVVGENVRRYRIEVGLSQAEVAARMGVEQGYVRRLERGGKNPTIVTVYHVAAALGVRPVVLFRTGSKRSTPIAKQKAEKILWQI
jgi:transcriptional regulator with XRE-family HTH domain